MNDSIEREREWSCFFKERDREEMMMMAVMSQKRGRRRMNENCSVSSIKSFITDVLKRSSKYDFVNEL